MKNEDRFETNSRILREWINSVLQPKLLQTNCYKVTILIAFLESIHILGTF